MSQQSHFSKKWIAVMFGVSLVACQSYDFVFQPDSDREGTHLRFMVQRPSKADILFVIDNSITMGEEQNALQESIERLVSRLADRDTQYRIGIVSTDSRGWDQSYVCNGETIPPVGAETNGAKGNCSRPEVKIRRPNDGALGRLLAAYDPTIFDPNDASFQSNLYAGMTTQARSVLFSMFPTSATTGPVNGSNQPTSLNGDQGARAVIDRAIISKEACIACSCTTTTSGVAECNREDACYQSCALPVAGKLVESYFRSNLAALGTDGAGWEEGLRSSMLAVGINAEDPNVPTAIDPGDSLLLPGRPNSFLDVGDNGVVVDRSWLRDDALLAVMYVSDEQDCSMPDSQWDIKPLWEQCGALGAGQCGTLPGAGVGIKMPSGSICYQEETPYQDAQPSMLSVSTMADLLRLKKGGFASRVAVGFIGGAQLTSADPNVRNSAAPTDCRAIGQAAASTSCWSLQSAVPQEETEWACFSQNQFNCENPDLISRAEITVPDADRCDAMAGSRYIDFANFFGRRTFESICTEPTDGSFFGDALESFADIAVLACFDLGQVVPANNDPELIEVGRINREDSSTVAQPELLPRLDPTAVSGDGWYYDQQTRSVCLIGRDRLIGDYYDIFVLHKNKLDPTN